MGVAEQRAPPPLSLSLSFSPTPWKCSSPAVRSGQDSVGLPDAQQVVRAEGPPHAGPAHVFVLVLAQPRDGLEERERETFEATRDSQLFNLNPAEAFNVKGRNT